MNKMNYYEEILNEIREDIDNQEYEEAKRLIMNELSISYVPRDVEEKLYELLSEVKTNSYVPKTLSDEDIEKYLKMDEVHQLMAVEELNKKNLRDHIDLCQDYLSGNGYINAKVLMIDSLIRQEINFDFSYNDSTFNPSKITRVEESDGFLSGLDAIRERFMKDPSMMRMGEQLLYKEVLLALPKTLSHDEGLIVADKIIDYILKAFESAN